jgi:hypothetical protein
MDRVLDIRSSCRTQEQVKEDIYSYDLGGAKKIPGHEIKEKEKRHQ